MPKGYRKKKAPVSKKMATAIHKIVKSDLKKTEETKMFAASFGLTSIYGGTAGALMQHLTGLAQAITDSDRVGDEITVKHLSMNFLLRNQVGATSNEFNDIRILIFQYKATDMLPIPSEMFITNNALGGGAVNSAYSCRNIDYLGVYNVLYDKTFHLEAGTPNALNYATTGNSWKHVKATIPLKYVKRKIQFKAASTNTTNGLWLMAIGSSASVASNPQIGCSWCISYTDA